MAKFDFVKHISNVSKNLMTRYRLAEAYQHKGGKGEIREAILIDWLKELLPDTISVSKGEIVDSNLNRSREFDIVVYLNSPMPKIFSSQKKRVIPVETVLMVIEVKSHLNQKALSTFNKSLLELNKFRRYFRSTQLGECLSRLNESEPFPEGPILAEETIRGIGSVFGGIFAFEAPTRETIEQYFKKVHAPQNFFWCCVLESCFCTHSDTQWRLVPTEEHSLLFLVETILGLCKDNGRFTHVEPDFERYLNIASKALSKIPL